ncbi:PilZ domain-containing protein [Cohnella endophytica]|uniref:PilZ domain-containing protein n=1 Tax=Cohnella endophytica TaxID=2419778 RepID=A0A494X548_9BACL|nr:PilZ domain-containing protein [Cohnella endophytica]RKP45818.1 PilZ domain-containing protein [Cohnella endophytica]
MTQMGDNKSARVDSDKELLPLNVLLHCRTVVEGKNFVTTGVMTHVEGELFEVELPEFEQFELGETVKLTVYSPAGIQMMPSIVFAKYEGAIALLQPPDVQKRFKERREHPRVEISGNAQIVQILKATGEELAPESMSELTIHDISISGISFSGLDAPHFATNSRLKAKVEIGFGFNCELEIVRRERQEDRMHCGAIMQVLEPEMLRPLRALILRQQVEKHAQARRDLGKRRTFNG